MSPMSRRVPVAFAALLLSAPAWPQAAPDNAGRNAFTADEVRTAATDPKYFTLDESSVKVESLTPTADAAPAAANVLPTIGQIINLGQQIWKIIADNKPVVDVTTQFATALPKGVTGWTDLAGWQPPASNQFHLTANNAYGIKVVDVTYQVLRTYGGTYGGKGRYLTAVTVAPLGSGVNVLWGYHFNLTTTVPDTGIVNVGTSADPVAGMTVQTAWTIATVIKNSQGESTYFVEGDGSLRQIGDLSAPALKKAGAAITRALPSEAKPTRFD
jgi:hypothetical protein